MIGLSLMGIGLGNLFPMGVSLAVALAAGRSALASGRVVAMSSFAVVLAPLTVGTLADATSQGRARRCASHGRPRRRGPRTHRSQSDSDSSK